MEPFVRLSAVAAPIDQPNVDTDRIIPARFLRKPRSGGYGGFLFHDVRFGPDGTERPDFVLNQPAYRGARILVAADNFGCGSSREGAVWALRDWGIRAVIAPSFGDIFFENCVKNGVLPVVLTAEAAAALRARLAEDPGASVTVDLPSQTLVGPDGVPRQFPVSPFHQHCLLHGHDDIDLTLEHAGAIEAYEERQRVEAPWLVS